MSGQRGSLYDLFDLPVDCSGDELRMAYRNKARQFHPDVASSDDGGRAMARLNDAWRILSDPRSRRQYDQTIDLRVQAVVPDSPQPPPRAGRPRRMAWIHGIQAQMARLTRQAGRSATQTLLLRHPRGTRADYEGLVERLLLSVLEDTEARVRAARAAGAAPLDLASGACLIALRTLSDRIRREAVLGITTELVMTAELIDRMWDIMAHELRNDLVISLGGNPHVANSLSGR